MGVAVQITAHFLGKKAWSSSCMVSSGWVKILGAFSLRLAPIMVRQRSV